MAVLTIKFESNILIDVTYRILSHDELNDIMVKLEMLFIHIRNMLALSAEDRHKARLIENEIRKDRRKGKQVYKSTSHLEAGEVTEELRKKILMEAFPISKLPTPD